MGAIIGLWAFRRRAFAVIAPGSLDLRGSDAASLAERLRVRDLSVEALTRAYLDRIAARDTSVRAWACLDPDAALAAARELDARGPRGPLFGLPVGVKDIFLTKDMPTAHNSPLYEGSRPGIDAACVAVLRAAGALILGKTDTVEFAATGRRALTRNPHDLTRTPGGSSSGSAAAVADGQVPLTLGTQTGGSIVRPAAFCGVFGMKPTWGVVSLEGAKRFAPTLDTVGWFGRSVADLALLYELFDPLTAADRVTVESGPPLRIALCRSPSWDQADESTRRAFAATAERLRESGASLTELELPEVFNELLAIHKLIMHAEGRASFLAESRTHPELLHESFRRMVDNADAISRKDLLNAYDVAAARRVDFDRLSCDYDAVLTPSVIGPPPVGLADTGSFIFNAMWSVLQVPCINFPVPRAAGHLPLGLTLTGPRFSDRRLLEAAGRISPGLAELPP
jgi:Asp-tRNA(Asn)/Glu-tRNA(Gln) amidotransferase A subunit family amidase